MKWWVRLQKIKDEDFRLKSFMTEMIVSHLADSGVSMADYTIALEKIFTYIVKSRLKSADLLHGLLPGVEAAGAYRASQSRFSIRSTKRIMWRRSTMRATGKKLWPPLRMRSKPYPRRGLQPRAEGRSSAGRMFSGHLSGDKIT